VPAWTASSCSVPLMAMASGRFGMVVFAMA
jgi:hypothetical protein